MNELLDSIRLLYIFIYLNLFLSFEFRSIILLINPIYFCTELSCGHKRTNFSISTGACV